MTNPSVHFLNLVLTGLVFLQVCNGVAVVLIQNFVPHYTDSCPDCRNYFRSVLVWGSGAAAFMGLLALLSLLPAIVGQRREGTVPGTSNQITTLRVNEDPTERTPLIQHSANVNIWRQFWAETNRDRLEMTSHKYPCFMTPSDPSVAHVMSWHVKTWSHLSVAQITPQDFDSHTNNSVNSIFMLWQNWSPLGAWRHF